MKIGLVGCLFLIFLVLKLCHVINWSWIWIFSPLWIGLAAGLGTLGIIFMMWVWLMAMENKVK